MNGINMSKKVQKVKPKMVSTKKGYSRTDSTKYKPKSLVKLLKKKRKDKREDDDYAPGSMNTAPPPGGG